MRRETPWARFALLVILTCPLLVSACTSTSTQVQHPMSSHTTSTQPQTSPARTATPKAPLRVAEYGFQAVSFEHWVDGSSVTDSGTTWGVVMHNATTRTALDVTVTVTFVANGSPLKRETVHIDAVPPGDTALGGYPVIVTDKAGQPVDVDGLTATAHATKWVTTSRPRDRLLSPDHVSIDAWKGKVRFEPVEDTRPLFVMVAYLDADGNLLSVDPSRVEGAEVKPGSPKTAVVAGRPEGGGTGAESVRVFLLRISDTTGLVPVPARGPRG